MGPGSSRGWKGLSGGLHLCSAHTPATLPLPREAGRLEPQTHLVLEVAGGGHRSRSGGDKGMRREDHPACRQGLASPSSTHTHTRIL